MLGLFNKKKFLNKKIQLKIIPNDKIAEIKIHPAWTFLNIKRGVWVADLINSSAKLKTWRHLANGIPSWEWRHWESSAAKQRENPLIASGDFFMYSSRLRQRSTSGVVNEGIDVTIHLKYSWVWESMRNLKIKVVGTDD